MMKQLYRFYISTKTGSCLKLQKIILSIFLAALMFPDGLFAQTASDSTDTRVMIEYRPRAEFKSGYKTPHTTDDKIAYTMSHRADLTFRHRREKAEVYFTFRNADIWGDNNNRMPELFEAWAEYSFAKYFTIRAGRQRLMLDNERLIGQKNWTQEGISHDVIQLFIKMKKFESSLISGFNQRTSSLSGTSYPWQDVFNYKQIHILNFQIPISEQFTFSSLNIAESFELPCGREVFRYTNGGRLTFSKKLLTTTVNAYYQHGRNPSDIAVNAWYANPEIGFKAFSLLNIRGGAEIFSGSPDGISDLGKSFSTLYGNGHKFNGHMDYFTSFPAHHKGFGLINPYLMLNVKIKNNLTLGCDFHTFHAMHPPKYLQTTQSKYLGFENDLTLTKKLNSFSDLLVGIAYALPTQSFLNMKGKPAGKDLQYFTYMMLTVKPSIFAQKR